MFDKICVVGIGLIGSSIARAIKKNNLCKELVAIDKNEEYLKYAMTHKIATKIYNTIDNNINSVDLFILATPIGFFSDIVNKLVKYAKKGAIITDAGSVKESVVKSIEEIIKNKDIYFIGSHPIAGMEKSGPQYGTDDLFKDKKCILTPTENTPQEMVNSVKQLWSDIGSNVEIMTPIEHDKTMAIVSHIPHLLAFAMVDLANKEYVLKYAGSGFKDFTRIAGADPTMWRDIFLENKNIIIKYLKEYIKILEGIDLKNDRETFEYIKKIQEIKINSK